MFLVGLRIGVVLPSNVQTYRFLCQATFSGKVRDSRDLSVNSAGRVGESIPSHSSPRDKSVGPRARRARDFFHAQTSDQECISDQ